MAFMKALIRCAAALLLVTSMKFGMAAQITMTRPASPEALPVYSLQNDTKEDLPYSITSSIEDTSGSVSTFPDRSGVVPAGQKLEVAAREGATTLTGTIALVRSKLTLGSTSASYSAIVGTPRPLPREGDFLIGMNVHLERYSAEDQWKLLQMMKAAGVQSVRMETTPSPVHADGSYEVDAAMAQSILGVEAFGLRPMVGILFFDPAFYTSNQKSKLAYDFARAIAQTYKGRVYDWQYGNEANAGWSAYGAAADMAAYSNAMALGTLSVDPQAHTSCSAIAEALPDYLEYQLRLGMSPYVRAISLHPYCGTPEAGISKLQANQQVIGKYGGHQEIWADEIGFHVTEENVPINPVTAQLTMVNGYTEKLQADQLARLFLLARAKKIDRVYWYTLFGKNDPETFWVIHPDFKPRPAFQSLKVVAPYVTAATALGGTASTELVQKHLFRKADGSVFLAAWALRDGVRANLHLPAGKFVCRDTMGDPVALEPGREITLGQRPLLIDELPTDTQVFDDLKLLVSTLDGRNFVNPMSRWEIEPGDTVRVPFVVYNAHDKAMTVYPAITDREPGWMVRLPAPFTVEAHETAVQMIELTASADSVRGVEHRFCFAAEAEGPRRSNPYEVRIWTKGQFPYGEYLRERESTLPYKTRRPIDEAQVTGFGREQLEARYGHMTVDGNLLDWDPTEFATLDQRGNWILRDVTFPDRKDAFVRAAVRWDESYLYAAFIVQDDQISTADLTSRDWRDSDNVRVFLSGQPLPLAPAKPMTETDMLVLFAPTREAHSEPPAVQIAALGGYVHKGVEKDIKVAGNIWRGGYVIEAAIPFAAIRFTPKAGATLGCNLMSDDADQGYRKNSSLMALRAGDYWNNPTTTATLKLLPQENGKP